MFIFYLPAVYAIFSWSEWFVHKHVMHTALLDDSHMAHHCETRYDMSLSFCSDSLDTDVYRGTAFSWPCTICIAAIAWAEAALVYAAIYGNVRVTTVTAVVLGCALYQGVMWNTVHTRMHGMRPPSVLHGAPSIGVRNMWTDYLECNHIEHHHSYGKRRFNVTLPGADFFMGTY
mmetsp:Transcript_10353/g.25707  ORF Transcript_10353/g.25707 Transcript_10353/m.25707 type:complete len:174 (-) Transcript_10353:190-711(-)